MSQTITLKLFVSRASSLKWVIDEDKLTLKNCETTEDSTIVGVKSSGYIDFKNTDYLYDAIYGNQGTVDAFACKFRVTNPGTVNPDSIEIAVLNDPTIPDQKRLVLKCPISSEGISLNTWYIYEFTLVPETNEEDSPLVPTVILYDEEGTLITSATLENTITDPDTEDPDRYIEVDLMETGFQLDDAWVWRAVKQVSA